MWTLGINWKWHDGAAALVDDDGRLHALAEEERFTRRKHAWGAYPSRAARFCLASAGITWRDLDTVVIGWDLPQLLPWADADREELFVALFGEEATGNDTPALTFVEHHVAHAASAFHASGFDRAGVLVVDGAGEREAISIYAAGPTGLTLKRRWPRAFSLGAMYEATTRFAGLGDLNAGKTMGLAAYGGPLNSALLPIGDLVGGGGPTFDWPADMAYEGFVNKWIEYLTDRFGKVTHPPADLDRDTVAIRVAANTQRTTEEAMRALHTEAQCLTGVSAICVAGGVALNCVANGRLPEPLYVPPFPHDAGVALGAAWTVSPPAARALLDSPYHGTDVTLGAELAQLHEAGFAVRPFASEPVIDLLLAGKIGAVAEGRAEIGPRALGHRSILALPRSARMRDRINTIKGRERWRPLAPVTVAGYAPLLWSSQGLRELYMVGSAVVSSRGRRELPATTHVDGTTRPQTMPAGHAPVVESLLAGLAAGGAPPVLVNTSFNGPAEPIVDSAGDAVRTFVQLGLDFLILADCLVTRR
jgi:carbamoyltransferase